MRYEEIRELLRGYFADALATHKQTVLDQGRLSPFLTHTFEEDLKRLDAMRSAGLKPGADQAALDGLVLDDILAEAGVPHDLAGDVKSRLLAEYQSASRSYSAAVLAFDASLAHYDLEGGAAEGARRKRKPASGKSVTVASLAEQFASYNAKQGVWSAATKNERARHFDLLAELVGADSAASDLTVEDAIHVRDMLLDMPSNRNKKVHTKGLAVADQVAVTDAAKMKQRTVRKYLQTFHSLFAWAALEKRVPSNPFDGITNATNSKALETEARDAFTASQVVTMLHALDAPRERPLDDYQKWGSLIGIYTGARVNEVCQLEVTDIREVGGVLCFDLNDEGDDKSLKTGSSKRVVPVHSHLLQRGLAEFVQSVRDAGHVRLFYELTYDPKNKWGRALSRWFSTRFLVKLGLKTPKLAFHSLRHTIVTELYRANVEEPLVKSVVGHKRTGVTAGTYMKGYSTRQLRDALERYDPHRIAADADTDSAS